MWDSHRRRPRHNSIATPQRDVRASKRRHPEQPAFLPAGGGISRAQLRGGGGDPSLRPKSACAQDDAIKREVAPTRRGHKTWCSSLSVLSIVLTSAASSSYCAEEGPRVNRLSPSVSSSKQQFVFGSATIDASAHAVVIGYELAIQYGAFVTGENGASLSSCVNGRRAS